MALFLSALLVVHSFDSFRTVAGMNITTDATCGIIPSVTYRALLQLDLSTCC